MKKCGLSIIGFGRFGQFAAKILRNHFNVFVSDKLDKSKEAEEIGVNFVSLQEASSKNIVVLAVPISEFKNVLKEIKDYLKEGSLILDVCSVKVKPVKWMKEILPDYVEIIGTHPLFGPQTGAQGIEGLTLVLCPVKTKNLNKVKSFLEELGLKVIVTTPEEHDKQMANSQSIVHFISEALIKMGIKKQDLELTSYSKLLEMLEIVKYDSPQLFRDIQKFNPYTKEVREKFIDLLLKINEKQKNI